MDNFSDPSSFILTVTNGLAFNIPRVMALHSAFMSYAAAESWEAAGAQYGKLLTTVLGPVLKLDNSVPPTLYLY